MFVLLFCHLCLQNFNTILLYEIISVYFFGARSELWLDKLDGSLFKADKGYRGPGTGEGNNVYSIGTYSSWQNYWDKTSKQAIWTNTDAWVNYFTSKNFKTNTEYFLYLIDESDNFAEIETWADWINTNPGPGKNLMSLATMQFEHAVNTPSLDIVATVNSMIAPSAAQANALQTLLNKYINTEGKLIYFYNGQRPFGGTFCTEDDGVTLRVTAWSQFKFSIDRWFYWAGTYYNDYQSGYGDTNVFQSARTYGFDDGFDNSETARGRTGWNYTNGDGVLYYPGTDRIFPQENYGVKGPFASLRLKYWRREIQDHDYLSMAYTKNPTETKKIIDKIIPKVFWEYGCGDRCDVNDPTWVNTDISWSIDPDVWEAARKQLADIIEKSSKK